MESLANNGLGALVPSPIALEAAKNKDWKPVNSGRCSGSDGTLIQWMGSNRAEFCPTGSTPVQGPGWSSFACDDSYTKEATLHCCNVAGKLRCVNRFKDMTEAPANNCQCHQVGGNKEEELVVATAAMPLMLLLAPTARTKWSYKQGRNAKARQFL